MLVDTQTRKERQATVRSQLIDALQELRRIDEDAMETVYGILRNAGVDGDDRDLMLGLKKLHSLGVIQLSHPRYDSGEKLHQRRHVIRYNG